MRAFDLPSDAVGLLAASLGIDCAVFPFQIPGPPAHPAERRVAWGALLDDLHHRGLAVEGELLPEVERAVRTLASQEVAIVVVGAGEGDVLLARASRYRRRAVVVVLEGERLRFSVVRPEAMVRTVVGLLPKARPGRGHSVTVPGGGAQERVARDILGRERRGDGYIAVSAWGRLGDGVSWVDTDVGRYLAVSRGGFVEYFPADTARTIHAVDEAVQRLGV